LLPRMGAYREWIDVDPVFVVPVPGELTDEKAALLPLNYLTAYAMITRCTRLEEGQSLIIHGAAGGVGTAVLELARLLGIKAYGTASPAKHDLVRSLGGVPLNRRDDAWMDELARLEPLGVDAAFDAYGVESFRKSWSVLSPRGTLVCYGTSPTIDGGTGEFIRGALSIAAKMVFSGGRRAAFCGLPGIIGSDHEWFREAMTKVLEWTREGALQPVLAGVLPWNEVEEVHRRLAEGGVRGKFLLDFSR
jgi:NADPH:quinone reductase-like Zn-dependent oxidoreductase